MTIRSYQQIAWPVLFCLGSAAIGAEREIYNYAPERGGAYSLAFAPNGNVLAVGEWNKVTIHDISQRKVIAVLPVGELQVNAVTFSPDGKLLALATPKQRVSLWDVATKKKVAQFGDNLGHGPRSIAFAPDGKSLFMTTYEHVVKCMEVATGKELRVFRGHQGHVSALAVSQDGELLVTGSSDGTVRTWATDSGKELVKIEAHGKPVVAIALSPAGKHIASAERGSICMLWRVSGEHRTTYNLKRSMMWSIWDLCFTPDGKAIAVVARTPWVQMLSIEGPEVPNFGKHEGGIATLVFSRDGKLAATASFSSSAKVWELSGK